MRNHYTISRFFSKGLFGLFIKGLVKVKGKKSKERRGAEGSIYIEKRL